MKISESLWNEVMFMCFADEPKFVPTYKEVEEYVRYVSTGKGKPDFNRILKKRSGVDFASKQWRYGDFVEGEVYEHFKDFPYYNIIKDKLLGKR